MCYGLQPGKLGLARTSCWGYLLLSLARLAATKQAVLLAAQVKHVGHLAVLTLWHVEDQQVWQCFVFCVVLVIPSLLVLLEVIRFFKNISFLFRFE